MSTTPTPPPKRDVCFIDEFFIYSSSLDRAPNFQISVTKYIDTKKYVSSSLKNSRTCTIVLSNLGFVKQDDYNQFKIVDMVFNQPPSRSDVSFGCNVLGTSAGGVNLSLTCTIALKKAEFETFVNGVKYGIYLAIKNC